MTEKNSDIFTNIYSVMPKIQKSSIKLSMLHQKGIPGSGISLLIYLVLLIANIVALFEGHIWTAWIFFISLILFSPLMQVKLWKQRNFFALTSKLITDRAIFFLFIITVLKSHQFLYSHHQQNFIYLIVLYMAAMMDFLIWYDTSNQWLSLSTLMKSADNREKFISEMQNSDWTFMSNSYFYTPFLLLISVSSILTGYEHFALYMAILILLLYVFIYINKINFVRRIQRTLRLKVIIHKSRKAVDGVFATYFCTPLAQKLLPIFQKSGMSPDAVTVTSALMCLAGTGLLVAGGTNVVAVKSGSYIFYTDLISAFLIYLAFVLDIVDGELARSLGVSSYFGSWLDRSLDRFTDTLLMLAIIFRAYKSGMNEVDILLWSTLFLLTYLLFWTQNAAYTIIDSTMTRNELPQSKPDPVSGYFRSKGLIIHYGRDMFVLMAVSGIAFGSFAGIMKWNVIYSLITFLWLLRNHYKRNFRAESKNES